MKILFFGDVVGQCGVFALKKSISELKKEFPADVIAVNGENINPRNGITKNEAEELLFLGIDVITLGNHAFRQQNIYDFLDDSPKIIRPANYAGDIPGYGYTTVKTPVGTLLFINLVGQINLEPADNPFFVADKIISSHEKEVDFIIVDFHAEATSEKKAMGYYLDGRVFGVFGTHTHVQTADETFLPKGTAYITDVGMTGAAGSVLGAKTDLAIKKFISKVNITLEQSEENPCINAVYVDGNLKIIKRIMRNVQ